MSLIHNVFFSRGAVAIGLAAAVLSLPVPLIGPPFGALPISEASGVELLKTGKLTAGVAAISLAAITVGTNEEEAATL